MIHEDRIFVAGVVVIELTWEMMVANVINWLISVIVELSTITKIYKYRGLHK
jgi:hypothetical protein